jgi:hypothetical protein
MNICFIFIADSGRFIFLDAMFILSFCRYQNFIFMTLNGLKDHIYFHANRLLLTNLVSFVYPCSFLILLDLIVNDLFNFSK